MINEPLTTIPVLSPDRLSQMISLAATHRQDAKTLAWHQRLHLTSRRLAYGLSATAVSASCIAAFWAMPLFQVTSEGATGDITLSEYMMQDLLEELV